MKTKQILALSSAIAIILMMHFYLTWKYNPFRAATKSEKENFIKYNDFNNGTIDDITKKIHSIFYLSSSEKDVKRNELTDQNTNIKNQEKSINSPCTGPGDETCKGQISDHFSNKNQSVLDINYQGDGVFMVTFVDDNGNGGNQALVDVNCDCKILDVRIAR